MARSVRTLPLASVGGHPEFSPTNEQWKQIERAYGHALSDNVRQDIVAATIDFLLFEPFERAAEPVSLARERVLTVQKAAKNLHDALVALVTVSLARERVLTVQEAAKNLHDGGEAGGAESGSEGGTTGGGGPEGGAAGSGGQGSAEFGGNALVAAKAVTDALVTAEATTATFYAHHLIKQHFADEAYWSRKFRG